MKKSIISVLLVLTSQSSIALGSSDLPMSFDPKVQGLVENDPCAKKASAEAASAAFAKISDSGADWPDEIYISNIIKLKKSYSIVAQGIGFSVPFGTRCKISQASETKTIVGAEFRSKEALELINAGSELLGGEIFNFANLGGVSTFTIADELLGEIPFADAIGAYLSEWGEASVTEFDNSKVPYDAADILTAIQVEGSDPDQADAYTRIHTALASLIKARPGSLEIVEGTWQSNRYVELEMSFVAILFKRTGQVIVLEQGYED